MHINDKVRLSDERTGCVRYIGSVEFAAGEWIGIALDNPFVGENDGVVNGKRYFKCSNNKGILVRREKVVEVHSSVSSGISLSTSRVVPYAEKFRIGFRVSCDNRTGTVRFIGPVSSESPDQYLGVELDPGFKGTCDGYWEGKHYFSCALGQGIFIKPHKALLIGENTTEQKEKHRESQKNENVVINKPVNTHRRSKSLKPYTQLLSSTQLNISSTNSSPWKSAGKLGNQLKSMSLRSNLNQAPYACEYSDSEAECKVLKETLSQMEYNITQMRKQHAQKLSNYELSKRGLEKQVALIQQDATNTIMSLRETLERAGQGNISARNHLSSAEMGKRLRENKLTELNEKLAKVEEQTRRNQELMKKEWDLFFQEKMELQKHKSDFSSFKAEVINDRKRMEKVVREKDIELEGCQARYEIASQQLNTLKERLASKCDEYQNHIQALENEQSKVKAVKEEVEIEKKQSFEKDEQHQKTLETIREEKQALEQQILVIQNKIQDVEKKLSTKINTLEVNAMIIAQDEARIKKMESTLEKQRLEVEDKVLEAEKKTKNWMNLVKQSKREKSEVMAEKNDIEDSWKLLSRERDDIRIESEKLEEIEQKLLSRKSGERKSSPQKKHSLQYSLNLDLMKRNPKRRYNFAPGDLPGSSSEGEEDEEGSSYYSRYRNVRTELLSDGAGGSEYNLSIEPSKPNQSLFQLCLAEPNERIARNPRDGLSSPTCSEPGARWRQRYISHDVWYEKRRRHSSVSERSSRTSPRISADRRSRDSLRMLHHENLLNQNNEENVPTQRESWASDQLDLDSKFDQEKNLKKERGSFVSPKHSYPNDHYKKNSVDTLENAESRKSNELLDQNESKYQKKKRTQKFEFDPKQQYNSMLLQIEEEIKNIRDWINNMKRNMSSLPESPSTFDEILATIEPQRTKKIKKKSSQITELIVKRNSLTKANSKLVQDHFLARVENIIALEKECERELKIIEQSSNSKISKAALQFKRNLPKLIDEYWVHAAGPRNILQDVIDKWSEPLPEEYRTVAMAQSAYDEAIQDQKLVNKLKVKISWLKKMGRCIGKIKSQKAKSCLDDTVSLEKLYDSASRMMSRRLETINENCKDQSFLEKTTRMTKLDAEHEAKYLEIMKAAGQKMDWLSQCEHPRSQGEYYSKLRTINSILDDQLPKWKNCISSELTQTSGYLTANGYKLAEMVIKREAELEEILKQTEKYAVKFLTQLQSVV